MPDSVASRAPTGRAAPPLVAAVAHVRSLSLATSLEPAAARAVAETPTRPLGARSMLDARSFMISTLRSQVGFAAAVAHARLRLSRLELIGGSGRTAGRYASAARAYRLHFADRLRAGAGRRSGSGWRQGRVRWGRPLLSRPRGAVGSGPAAVESAAVSAVAWSCGCVVGFGWL